MPIVPISNVWEVGVVKDVPPYNLPPNVWSDCLNVRFCDGYCSPAHVNGPPLLYAPVPIYFFMPTYFDGGVVWLNIGAERAFVQANQNNIEITREISNYDPSGKFGWNGRVFNRLPVVTNGVDPPQVWSSPELDQKLIDLPNWPANTTASLIRTIKNFLVALNVTKNGINYPRLVKWSHSAAEGVPTSWDHENPTVDAGEVVLSEGFSQIVAAENLIDSLVIYTEVDSWIMRFIGGAARFGFVRLFPNVGAYSRDSVCPFGNRHFVVTKDDVVVHDGSQVQSIIDGKLRKWLFSSIEGRRVSVVRSYRDKEIWVCFGDRESLTTAAVWNWGQNTWGIREIPDAYSIASEEPLQGVRGGYAWSLLGPYEWESQDVDYPWVPFWGSPYDSGMHDIMVSTTNQDSVHGIMFFEELSRNSPITTFLERRGLSVVGQDYTGRIISDPGVVKFLRAIQPRFSSGYGEIVEFRIGSQMEPSDPIEWSSWRGFKIGEDFKLDFYIPGRLLSIAMRYTGYGLWKLEGYDFDVAPLGVF